MNATQTNGPNAAHTSTPWTTGLSTTTRRYVTNSSGSVGVCSVWCDDDEATGIANAAHIVRCVNAHDALVEALKACLPYVSGAYECVFPDSAKNKAVLNDARKALALANVD